MPRPTPKQMQDLSLEAVILVKEHGTIAKASRATGVNKRTLQDRYTKGLQLKKHPEKLLSEDASKFKAHFSAQDCVDELRRVAEIDTEKVISRNYFRNNGDISESTWNRFFGTFEEFKRQAGIHLTRQQHNLEKQVAKHASVDHYRAVNADRREFGEAYLKPNKGRWQTLLRGSDFHDIECDPFFLSVFLGTAKRVQPDIICLNGDIFDLPEFGKYEVDPRQWDVVGRIRFVHENILAPLREACPDAQIDLIEGNHEFRMLRHLADATPAMKAILSDLHGFTVAKLLGLDKYQINYVAKGDLAAYTPRDITKAVGENFRVYHNKVLAHHFPHGRNFGMPGFNGHHHTWKVMDEYSAPHGPYQWVQGGCGHVQDATYANGRKWTLEFGLVHIDTVKKHVQHECYPFADSFVVVGGKYYERK